jgi:2-polyprenyl-6-methoxyphenol hydroxylase-like FAD-dependent oxidoreductase
VKPAVGEGLVLGGSLAGLAAAGALARAGVKATLVERDVLPDAAEPRKGVPQSRHVHVLLAAGLAALERLFPGLENDLVRRGAVVIDASREAGLLGPGGWMPPFEGRLKVLSMSRDLLEAAVRARVRSTPGISVLDGHSVDGLKVDANGVRGAVVDGQLLEAGLVIDACGRGSNAPTWLDEIGFEKPAETCVDPHVGYASRVFRDVPPLPHGWRVLFLMCKPEFPRAALLFPIEGGQYIVSMAGAAHHRPPTDDAAFLEFACTLRSPLLADVIRTSTPAGPIYATRSTRNRWRHFERLSRVPAGFVPIGDSMCAFNPAYGQGITVACLEAELLADLVASSADRATLSRLLPRKFAKLIRGPWVSAVSQDTRVTTTDGERKQFMRVVDWYSDALWELATEAPDIARTLWRVYHLVASPSELLRPATFARVLAWRMSGKKPAPVAPNGLADAVPSRAGAAGR